MFTRFPAMRRLVLHIRPTTCLTAILAGWLVFCAARVVAQDEPPKGDDAPPKAAASPQGDDPLATRQSQVADRFKELERLLLRMAELTAPTDPRRAALLRRAVAQ